MKNPFAFPFGPLVFGLLTCTPKISAHSWIQQLRLIASNGTFVGTPGYPRGFVPQLPGFNPDIDMTYLIPPNGRPTGNAILSTDLMCMGSQMIGNYTPGYPVLTASPGDQIAMIYQENGHVTLLQNSPPGKPVHSGTIFVYGTKEPANTDTYLGIHRVWNSAGTGGDKRGKLLATRPFDDGECFQDNNSSLADARRNEFHPLNSYLYCQSDIQMPTDAGTSGLYTLYWLWEWPLLDLQTGAVVTNVSYTTCMDVNMTSGELASVGNFDTKQVIDSAAIEEQLSTQFLVNPTISEQLTGAPPPPTFAPNPASSASITLSGAASNASSQITSAVRGLATVTVTASPDIETVTITDTVNGGPSSPLLTTPPATSPAQTSPLSSTPETSAPPASSVPSSAIPSPQPTPSASGSLPPIAPFLNPSSQIASAPIAASTPSPASSSGTVREQAFVLRGRVMRK